MSNRAIFVTGASTGIGLATAIRLHHAGFRVFAGVLPGEDTAALDAEQIEIVPIDITKQEMIQTAFEKIHAEVGDSGLYGLFNNAGMAYPGPMEYIPLDVIRKQLDVNLLGHIAVTQAMMPLLRKAQGRIVNTTSILGRVAAPFSGPYCMSKFAMEAYTDALRQELESFGIHVVAIEPGAIVTPIWEKATRAGDEIWEELPDIARQHYQDTHDKMADVVEQAVQKGIAPDEVAKRVLHAFTAPKPKTRYLVGQDARIFAFFKWLLPDRWMDWLLPKMLGG